MIEIFEIQISGEIGIGSLANDLFKLVPQPEDADWILIPAFISSLTNDIGRALIAENHQLARSLNKPFGVFSNSDLIISPGVDPLYIFTPGAYATNKGQIELPAVIPYDPVDRWVHGKWRPLTTPSLGFCGQATLHPLKLIKDFLSIESMRLKKKRGKSPYLIIPRFMPAYERGKLLRSLEKSTLIPTNFILRSHYKGGASTALEKEKVEQEFYKNVETNMFTLCMRGMGNYSVRFYQTLAMGRIPVLIDTDSILPFSQQINYHDLVVRVPYDQRFRADEYILDYLKGKSEADLIAIQKRCRQVWLDNFRTNGMLINLAKTMQICLLSQGENSL